MKQKESESIIRKKDSLIKKDKKENFICVIILVIEIGIAQSIPIFITPSMKDVACASFNALWCSHKQAE